MALRTNILFYLLIRELKPSFVCDIGSRDGHNSIRFKRFSPGSQIIAFEANPYNAQSMKDNSQILAYHIRVENKAVFNKDGEAIFYVENLGNVRFKNGVSSLCERIEDAAGKEKVKVSTVRLDNYIKSQGLALGQIALWIDVEGAGYEALEGISGIQEKVSLIHIEVETKTFWKGQRLKPEVESLLDSMGFRFMGRGMPEEQHDLVYINKNIFNRSPLKFKGITLVSFVFSYLQAITDVFKVKKLRFI